MIGARVTGVRPGIWVERQGLLRGDVITAFDDRVFTDAESSSMQLCTIERPGRIDVVRTRGGTTERVTLGGS